ncbi:MAG TPA: aminotransferase class V-fold PLP-dependent enzyme [Spirochaetia bacterium]|nr:aminotransferase class V-fold PLP-dependent enzyme [Spirochaetia bacterium]
MEEARGQIYRELGITPVINAFEAITIYGGSLMPEEVLDAMRDASQSFISIPELNRKVGARIAALTRNEAAFVTAGCAAAIALSLAACMTGLDARKVAHLPCAARLPCAPAPSRTEDIKDEVIVHRCQRNPYDRAALLTGARFVEFGYPATQARTDQLEEVVSDRSAAILYFAGGIFEQFALPLKEVVRIGRKYKVPVVVDAAAQLPPPENLWRYTETGADLALFSGGKGIRGPQNSGLIVGKRELIQAVEINSSPFHTFGRPMKTSKETIAGLLKALELFLNADHTAEYNRMEGQVRSFLASLLGTPGIETDFLATGRHGQLYPRGLVRLTEGSGFCRDEFMTLLEKGDPPVLVGPMDGDARAFTVNPYSLKPGQEQIVAGRIQGLLGTRGTAPGRPVNENKREVE